MLWKKSKGKIVISSNGVNKAFTPDELLLLEEIIQDIKTDNRRHYQNDNRND